MVVKKETAYYFNYFEFFFIFFSLFYWSPSCSYRWSVHDVYPIYFNVNNSTRATVKNATDKRIFFNMLYKKMEYEAPRGWNLFVITKKANKMQFS